MTRVGPIALRRGSRSGFTRQALILAGMLATAQAGAGPDMAGIFDATIQPGRPERGGTGEGPLQTRPDGTRYQGDFRHGLPEGQGVMRWPDGRVYEGTFVRGGLWGHGIMTWPDGRRYEGDFAGGAITGEGRFRFADGARYRGAFRNGLPHGLGTWREPDGTRYTGEYEQGVRDGWGEYRWPDGTRYVGEFRDGRRTGQGTLIDADGTLWRGAWLNGRRHGTGIRVGSREVDPTLQRWEEGVQLTSRSIKVVPGCRLRHENRRWMVIGSDCEDGLAHGRGDAVSTDGTLWIEGARFARGSLAQGAPIALGQPPEAAR